jgi:hypothetical protein
LRAPTWRGVQDYHSYIILPETKNLSTPVRNYNKKGKKYQSAFSGNEDISNGVKFPEKSSQEALEVGGIEPPGSWVIILNPHQATPRARLLYHNIAVAKRFVPAFFVR